MRSLLLVPADFKALGQQSLDHSTYRARRNHSNSCSGCCRHLRCSVVGSVCARLDSRQHRSWQSHGSSPRSQPLLGLQGTFVEQSALDLWKRPLGYPIGNPFQTIPRRSSQVGAVGSMLQTQSMRNQTQSRPCDFDSISSTYSV
jgi:hypothetical protein